MKTILFIIIAIILNCTGLLAQFEINSSFNPVPGNEEKIWSVNAKELSPGKAGENVAWDFSKISPAGDSNVTVYTISSATPYYKDFPLSNLASFTLNGNSYIYYKVLNDSYESLGNGQKFGVIKYLTPQILMQYPLSYNQSFTSNFTGSGTSEGYKFNICGTFTVTCDSYGTIILPSGKSDVIRLRSVCIVYDTLYSDNAVMSSNFYTSITYNRYKKNYRFSIFYIDETTSNNGTVQSAGYVKNSLTVDNSRLKTDSY